MIEEAASLQHQLPWLEMVMVGGSAAALHAGHHYSEDWIPTPAEALRIKAFLLTERKATRDYLDVAALADLLGEEASVEALSYLNLLYEPVGNQTRLTKFVEVCQQEPLDLPEVDLRTYKGIVQPYDSWAYVSTRCRTLAREVFIREMEDALPRTLDEFPAAPEIPEPKEGKQQP